VPIDPARSLDFMMSGYQRDIRDARREFNAKLLRGDPINPQDIIDRYIIANKAKWETMKDMSNNITAAKILGTSPRTLRDILGRVSKKDAEALGYDDDFIPFTISENIQEVFADNARKLGMPNPYRQASSSLRNLYRLMSRFSLSMSEWPDLTDIFNLNPEPMGDQTQTPIGTPGLNPQVFQRPSLTLNPITGLTNTQTALLSPSDQAIARKQNQTRIT